MTVNKSAAGVKTSKYGSTPALGSNKASGSNIKDVAKAKTPNAAVKQATPNIWSSLTDNNLATVDVYQQSQSGTINSISDFSNTFNFDLGGLLKGGSEMIKRFKKAQENYIKIKDAVNKGISIDRLGSLGDAVKHGLASMGVDTKSDLFKAVESSSVFLSKVGDSYQTIKNVNWNNVNSITDMVNNLAGTKVIDLSDIGAEAQYLVSLVNTMSEHGIDGAVDSLKDIIKANPLMNDIVKGILPNALQNSDTKTLSSLIDVAGKELVNSVYGDLLRTYSQSYGRSRSEEKNMMDQYQEFIKLSESLGMNGVRSELNGQSILNFSSILSGTEAFESMLKQSSKTKRDDYQYLGFVDCFRENSVEEEIRNHFPRVIIQYPTSQSGHQLLVTDVIF